MNRAALQQLFIRICRDSGFGLEASRAANITARAANVHPIDVWVAFGSLATMDKIANGEHPAAREGTHS